MPDLSLQGMWIYPIKSLKGIAVTTGMVEPRGLRYDRRWMLVNDEGRFLTQRQIPRMALISVTITEDGLICSAEGQNDLSIPFELPEQQVVSVAIWRDFCDVARVSVDADNWFTTALGQPCHLVHMPESTQRQVNPTYGQPEDHVSFADGYPYLILGAASLADLNRRLPDPIAVQRFRPNLFIAGAAPFAEDTWRQIQIGPITFEIVKPCARCTIPLIDPARGVRDGNEPLRTLATFRKVGSKILFGQNAIARGNGHLTVGDVVTVGIRKHDDD